jgi:mannitol-specific phosphotransferase system IIBC component
MAEIDAGAVRKVVIACDAGMGSSVMVAAQLEDKLKPYSVSVTAASIEEIPEDADLVLCQDTLLTRARRDDTGKVILGFHSFLGDPVFDEVEAAIRDGGRLAS